MTAITSLGDYEPELWVQNDLTTLLASAMTLGRLLDPICLSVLFYQMLTIKAYSSQNF